MAMAEYAWTSFQSNAKVFEKAPQNSKRFHPTQKPIQLYTWILKNYAKRGDKILDTHVGSASSLIACERMRFDYVGFEIDKEYYELAKKRLDEEKAQLRFELLPWRGLIRYEHEHKATVDKAGGIQNGWWQNTSWFFLRDANRYVRGVNRWKDTERDAWFDDDVVVAWGYVTEQIEGQ